MMRTASCTTISPRVTIREFGMIRNVCETNNVFASRRIFSDPSKTSAPTNLLSRKKDCCPRAGSLKTQKGGHLPHLLSAYVGMIRPMLQSDSTADHCRPWKVVSIRDGKQQKSAELPRFAAKRRCSKSGKASCLVIDFVDVISLLRQWCRSPGDLQGSVQHNTKIDSGVFEHDATAYGGSDRTPRYVDSNLASSNRYCTES